MSRLRLGTAPDSWGVWFADDPAQTPWQRFLDEVVMAGYEWVELGRGPFLRLTLAPGVHEVKLRARGEERVRFVLIRSARRTRLPLPSAFAR